MGYDEGMIDAVLLTTLLALFLLAYLTRRRFGVLGLGLAAGVILANQFADPLTASLEASAMDLGHLSAGTWAQLILILSPALLLLVSGPKYASGRAALLGASGFVVLTLALLLEPLSADIAWLAQDLGQLVEFLAEWQGMVVAIGVIVAVIDMFMSHNSKFLPKRSKH